MKHHKSAQSQQDQLEAGGRRSALAAVVEVLGRSPADPNMLRIKHAETSVRVDVPPEPFFNAFSRWSAYESWTPDVQGLAHWLVVREGGPGSQFILYDKPGARHLVHFVTVSELDRHRRFVWRAPFSEWSRAYVGTILEVHPQAGGGSQVSETLYFDVREDHLPVVAGIMALSGLNQKTMTAFLEARLRGLDRAIRSGEMSDDQLSDLFAENRVVASDWAGRISQGEWVRLLFADGELDFPAPPDVTLNVFSRFARYADWTHTIHVGAEWHVIRRGGIGSRFLIWEKPSDRHVMHYGTITEFERNRHMAWRAPFAEWPKVFIGTSFYVSPGGGGGTHAYHVIWVDLPREYLPIFTGFGTLPGLDLEYETWHVHEEARGISELMRGGGFSVEDRSYLFEEDRTLAVDFPSEDGRPRPYPDEVLTLQPHTVMTYEEAAVAVAEMLSESLPKPQFFRKWRDQRRTRSFHRTQEVDHVR